MDVYTRDGKAFSALGQMDEGEKESFKEGVLRIGSGSINFTDQDLSSLYWMKQRVNSETALTNIVAKIFVDAEQHFILRLQTKVGNDCIGYTNTYHSIFRGPENVQLKYSAAQDLELTIDDIPYSSYSDVCNGCSIKALGDDVTITEF